MKRRLLQNGLPQRSLEVSAFAKPNILPRIGLSYRLGRTEVVRIDHEASEYGVRCLVEGSLDRGASILRGPLRLLPRVSSALGFLQRLLHRGRTRSAGHRQSE